MFDVCCLALSSLSYIVVNVIRISATSLCSPFFVLPFSILSCYKNQYGRNRDENPIYLNQSIWNKTEAQTFIGWNTINKGRANKDNESIGSKITSKDVLSCWMLWLVGLMFRFHSMEFPTLWDIKCTFAKYWINISYQSKVVVAHGSLSSITKTQVWRERCSRCHKTSSFSNVLLLWSSCSVKCEQSKLNWKKKHKTHTNWVIASISIFEVNAIRINI